MINVLSAGIKQLTTVSKECKIKRIWAVILGGGQSCWLCTVLFLQYIAHREAADVYVLWNSGISENFKENHHKDYFWPGGRGTEPNQSSRV